MNWTFVCTSCNTIYLKNKIKINFCNFTRFWHSQERLLLLHIFKLKLVKVVLTTSGQPLYTAPNNFQNFFSTCEKEK